MSLAMTSRKTGCTAWGDRMTRGGPRTQDPRNLFRRLCSGSVLFSLASGRGGEARYADIQNSPRRRGPEMRIS